MRRQRFRILLTGVLAIAGWLFVTACSTGGDAGDGGSTTPDTTLSVALASGPDSLNVYLARSAESLLIANRVLPRLWREVLPEGDRDYHFEPELAAEGWEFREDGVLLRIPLRGGLTWSDGSPVVCEDVRFTLDVQTDPALAWRGASLKRHITGMECEDDHTVIVRFDEAYPYRLMDVNDLHVLSRSLGAIPLETWREVDWSERMVTAGPFRVSEFVSGQSVVLERDPSHPAAGAGNVERIVFQVVPDESSRVTQLLAGDVDVVESIPASAAGRLANDPGVRLVRTPAWHYVYVGWNTIAPESYAAYRKSREAECQREGDDRCLDDPAAVARLAEEHPHPLLGDASVRRALTLAVDRQAIIDTLLESEGTVPPSPILSPLDEHDEELEPWPHDPSGARGLLARAGFADSDGDGIVERDGLPFRLRVLHHAGNRLRRDAAVMLQQDLAKVGVAVDLDPVESASFYPTLSGRAMDGWIARWRVSARVDTTEMLHADACGMQGANFGTWVDPEADRIALEARDMVDDVERAEAWHRWEAIFHREQPYTILFRAHHIVGVNARVRGTESLLSNDVLDGVETWTLKGDRTGR